MTQLDLPPISLARYVDLLKRRRWQVLPVSLLGLLVGAIVALLIPRYYVAETMVEFRGKVLGVDDRATDPMSDLVDTATVTMPWAVGDALLALKWPEASLPDAERRAFEDAVRKNVTVTDTKPGQQRRFIATLKVSYRDTDGVRAKEMCNAVVRAWKEGRQRELLAAASKELVALRTRLDEERKTVDRADQKIAEFQSQNAINPEDVLGNRDIAAVLSPRTLAHQALERQIQQSERAIAAQESQLAQLVVQLQDEPATVSVTNKANLSPPQEKQYATLVQVVSYLELSLQGMGEAHPDFALTQDRLKQAKTALAAFEKAMGIGAEDKENPKRKELGRQIDTLKAEIALARSQHADDVARFEQEQETLLRLPQVYHDWRLQIAERDSATKRLSALEAEEIQVSAQQEDLKREDPYKITNEAQVPPRPTEPNGVLVALAGCAVGLAFAIGLVLAIDALQSTFKTVDDVERVLALPVLGGLSHMTTDAERHASVVRRTRTAVVVGVVLVLMLSLITIYYVDPTRLPAGVRDVLAVLLGTPTEPSAARVK